MPVFEVLVASGPSRGKGFRTGALIGAAVGLVVGLILFSGGDADVPDTVVPGSAAALGLLGGLVGTALPPPTSEKWESVPPHELRAIARGAGATR